MTDRPSYILFITDQQRYDNLGCNGHPVLQTPNIDAIANEGVNYDRFYVASPVCMPNRSSLMTCRMPTSHGVRHLGLPLSHDNVTFVELLRAAGYDTALIGKSHLQNVTDWPTQFDVPEWRDGYTAPPEELSVADKTDNDNDSYQYERQKFYDDGHKVPLPFYGFDHYDSVLRHGFNTGGDHYKYQKDHIEDVDALRKRNNQYPHDYVVPQAIRTKIPEVHYSSAYIADRAAEYLASRKGNDKPFFLMVSFPDPHHPFTPPGKYWDMYKPEDMPVPAAYEDDNWEAPDYIKKAIEDRGTDKTIGQNSGYSFAISKQEALEARALTCGMIAMVDDAVGRVRAAAESAGVADNTVQIYTSDHGDHLGEHKLLFKGAEQYDSLNHVPFIWADPKGDKGVRSQDIAQTLDIGSTILEHAKIEPAIGMQGKVMGVAGGEGRDAAHIQYETQRTINGFGKRPRVHSLIEGQWRLSLYLGECKNELFDLENDPGEMVNLWDKPEVKDVQAQLVFKLAEMEITAADRVPLPTSEA